MASYPSFEATLAYAKTEIERINLEHLRELGLYRKPFEYYLMGTYPPLKAMHPVMPQEVFDGASGYYNVYIHIPFCEQHCTFCHFAKEIRPKNERVMCQVPGKLDTKTG